MNYKQFLLIEFVATKLVIPKVVQPSCYNHNWQLSIEEFVIRESVTQMFVIRYFVLHEIIPYKRVC